MFSQPTAGSEVTHPVASASGKAVALRRDNAGTDSAWLLLQKTHRAGYAGNAENHRGQ